MKAILSGITVTPGDEGILSEMATHVTLGDEGAGAFVVVTQQVDDRSGVIRISTAEWPAIRAAINRLVRAAEGVSES